MAKRRRPRIIRNPSPADPALFEFPGVQARVERALATIRPGSAPRTCDHRLAHAVAGFYLCAQHPRQGLLCFRCMYGHVAAHDGQAEMACDSCDTIPEGGLLKPLAVRQMIAFSTPAGRSVLPVQISSLGVCRRCRGASEVA